MRVCVWSEASCRCASCFLVLWHLSLPPAVILFTGFQSAFPSLVLCFLGFHSCFVVSFLFN